MKEEKLVKKNKKIKYESEKHLKINKGILSIIEPPKKKKHWSKKSDLWLINFTSSNLNKVGYDFKKETLYIQFKDKEGNPSGDYKYLKVPLKWWTDFTLAESKGKYFSKAKYELVNMEKLV